MENTRLAPLLHEIVYARIRSERFSYALCPVLRNFQLSPINQLRTTSLESSSKYNLSSLRVNNELVIVDAAMYK